MVVGINHVPTSVYLKTSDILSDEKHCPIRNVSSDYNVNQNNDVVIKDNTNNIKCDFTKFIPPTPPTPGLVQLQVLVSS